MPSGHVDQSKPLRPLTDHAWDVLGQLQNGPIRSYKINAGVHDRLEREKLITWAYSGGQRMTYITEAGHAKRAKGER